MKKIKYIVSTILLGYIFTACNDNLEITPPSSIIPEDYLAEESKNLGCELKVVRFVRF